MPIVVRPAKETSGAVMDKVPFDGRSAFSLRRSQMSSVTTPPSWSQSRASLTLEREGCQA